MHGGRVLSVKKLWLIYALRFDAEKALPVKKVDAKISAKGIQVPSALSNIAKLLIMRSATTKKSTIITKQTNIAAVATGLV
jgi:hypothetical protein